MSLIFKSRGWIRFGTLGLATAGMLSLVALPLQWAKSAQAGNATVGVREDEEGQDGPDLALKWRRLSWRGPDGKIPRDGLRLALADRNAKIAAQAKMKLGVMAGTWASVGPNNVGGRTNWIAINPQNTSQLFTATAGGGIWKSGNAGASWAPVNDRFPSLGMGTVTFDPNSPSSSVLYAGFGEATFNGDALDAGGIFKSTDGGNTFSVLPSTVAFNDIGELAVKPGDSSTILAATRGGIRRSTDGGTNWTTFQNTKAFYNVTFSSNQPNRAIASYLDLTNFSTNSAYYTIDGGANWIPCNGTSVNSFYGRTVYAFDANNGNIVYGIQGVSNGTCNVLKSVDGGANFSTVVNVNVGSSQHWYDNALWLDPTNSNHMVMGALDMWQSTDGGASWTKISYWVNNIGNPDLPHADVHHIVSDPGYNGTTNRRVYVGCDGGMFVADDILAATQTSGWRGLNAGYVTTQFYGGSANSVSGRVIGGLQDNGTQITTLTSPVATMEFGGDGGWVAIDPNNTNNLYGEYVYARVHRSLDNGVSSNYIYGGLSDAVSGNANFIAPFILSPTNTKTMWVGGYALWRTLDATAPTPSWASVKAGTTDYFSALTEAPSNANVFYAGLNDGTVYKSTNATNASPSWTTLTGFPTNRYIGRIAVSATDPNKVYLGFGSFSPDNLYKSTDGGTNWTNASGSGATGLPTAPIHGLCVDPLNSDHVFAGTEVGLYESTDGGASWSTSQAGPNNASVDEVNYVQGTTDKVLIATHGRGAWVFTPQTALPKLTDITAAASIVGGNSVAVTVTLDLPAPTGGATVNFTSNNSAAIAAFNGTVPEGSTSAVINVPTKGVNADTAVTLTGSSGGGSDTSPVTVKKASLLKLTFAPSGITGGLKTYGTVALDGANGTTARTITLTNPSSYASMPASVNIPAQASSVLFQVTTTPVPSNQTVSVTATSGAQSKTGAFLIRVPAVASVALNKTTMVGGNVNAITVTLTGPAGSGGASVGLASTAPAANIPVSLLIPAGATSASATFTPSGVETSITGATVTASYAGSSKVLGFSLLKSSLLSLTFSPNPVGGGSNSVGLLKFDGAIGAGGRVVTLTESSLYVTVPVSITVPAGQRQVTFTANTSGVNTNTSVNVTAAGGPTRTGTLTVNKGVALSLVGPTSATGGAVLTFTMRINAQAGPSGATFNLSSSDPHAVTPATVTIPAGATSKTFTVNTTAGAGGASVSIFATSTSAGSANATFTLN